MIINSIKFHLLVISLKVLNLIGTFLINKCLQKYIVL